MGLRSRSLWALAVLLACSLGCAANIGASAVPEVHASYNDALVRSQNAQLLLNLVRMRYRDTPFFVDVTSVTNQQSFAGSLTFGTDLGVHPDTATSTLHPGAGASFSVTPTIVYTPLQGEAFVRRMVAPLSLYTVLALSTAGWNASRVLRVTVDRANDVRNASSAAGPTPVDAPVYRDFLELVEAVRTLQAAGALEVAPMQNNPESCLFVVRDDHDPKVSDASHTLQRLLKLGAQGTYTIVPFTGTTEPNQVHFRMRSVLSALYYLSAAVDAPPEHERLGLVTVTRYPDGTRFDWRDLFHKLFHVRTSTSNPTLAFTKTYYRGHWFYISDDDLDSKSTFQLIAHLVSMQAGTSNAYGSPLLTIPVGR
jgi:hypothetical protein